MTVSNVPSSSKSIRVFVIIPTYNERENIARIIGDILRLPHPFQVLVVDDGSPDGTGDIVDAMSQSDSRIHLMRRPAKLGLGTAYVEGFQRAMSQGADMLFEMDADYSHDPQVLPKLVEALNEFDVVVGSRYVSGISVVNWPLRRLAISVLASLYVRWVLKIPVNDPTSGFVGYHRKVLEAIGLDRIRSNGYAFQIEMKFKAYLLGFRIREIPIIFVDRFIGTSKISRSIVWEAIWIVWRLRWEALFHRKPASPR